MCNLYRRYETLLFVAIFLLYVGLVSCSIPFNARRALQDSNFYSTTYNIPAIPADWEVIASELVDVTGDGRPEWILIIFRPWRDWPIQKWSEIESPIRDFHDEDGLSCHLAVLDPEDGSEIWVGSPLPHPIVKMAVGDVDRDGILEVMTLRGDYESWRESIATHIDVWFWDEFGFTLKYQFPIEEPTELPFRFFGFKSGSAGGLD